MSLEYDQENNGGKHRMEPVHRVPDYKNINPN